MVKLGGYRAAERKLKNHSQNCVFFLQLDSQNSWDPLLEAGGVRNKAGLGC